MNVYRHKGFTKTLVSPEHSLKNESYEYMLLLIQCSDTDNDVQVRYYYQMLGLVWCLRVSMFACFGYPLLIVIF